MKEERVGECSVKGHDEDRKRPRAKTVSDEDARSRQEAQ